MPEHRRASLAKAWSTIKSVTPFVRSPSNRTILLNPELIEAVTGPLQRAKTTAQHVLPVDAVVDRLTSLRHHAASEVGPSRLPGGAPLDAIKPFLPTAKAEALTPRIAIEDIWREIEIEKHLLVQKGPEIIAECERKLQGLLGHPPSQQLDRVKTLVEHLGLEEEVLRGLLPHQVPTVETMQQLALLNRLLDAPPTSDLPGILLKAKTLADKLSHDHPSGNLPAKLLKTVAHASHSEEPDKYQDLFSLLKAVSKASPKKEHNHVLAMLTHLANDVLDEKIELIKLSLSEAGVACHALYSSFFLLILAVMFCALTVFLLSLAMTQFLATFFLVSYLDSLWITTGLALTIGLVLGLLGIAILKRTMIELRTLLLSPRELKKPKSGGKKKKPRADTKPKLDDNRLGSWSKDLAEEDALERTNASPPDVAVPCSDETLQTQPDDVAPSTREAEIPVLPAAKEPEPKEPEPKEPEPTIDALDSGTATAAMFPPDTSKRPSLGLKRLPSISEDADEVMPKKFEMRALIENEIAPILSAMVSLVEALDCSVVSKPDDILVDLPRQDSSDCFGDIIDSDTQAEAWLLQDMANALQLVPDFKNIVPRVQALLLPPLELPTLLLLSTTSPAIEPRPVAPTTALSDGAVVETPRVEATLDATDESALPLPSVPKPTAIEPPTPLPPAPVVVTPSLVPILVPIETPTQTLVRPRRVPLPTSLAVTPKLRRRPSAPNVLIQRSRTPVVRMLSSPLLPTDEAPMPSVPVVDDTASDDGSCTSVSEYDCTSDVPML